MVIIDFIFQFLSFIILFSKTIQIDIRYVFQNKKIKKINENTT
jgi:hypothetical protein